MKRALALGLLLLVAGCGGGSNSKDPTQSVPNDNGVREAVNNATLPGKTAFPQPAGQTLEQLAKPLHWPSA